MLLGRDKAVGLDIGEGAVKAVETSRDGKSLSVRKRAVRSLPPTLSPKDPEAMGAFLRNFFADSGFRSRQVYLGVPRHQAILRTIRIPAGDESETQQMIRLQARKVLPMNGEGLKIGYVLREAEGERSAVVVGVKEEVLQGYLGAVMSANLKPCGVTLSSFGTANAYLNAYPDGAPGVVVDIGARMTEITLSAWGRFASSRQASIGVEDLVKALGEEGGLSKAASSQAVRGARLGPGAPPGTMSWARSIAGEVDRTLRAFTTEGLPVPERVLVTGGGSRVEGLESFLTEQLGVRVEAFRRDVGVEGWPAEAGEEVGAQFIPAVGYLLGGFAGVGTRFDLGGEFFAKADVKARPLKKYLAAAAVILVLLAGWLIPDRELSRMEADARERMESLVEEEKRQDEALDVLMTKLNDLRTWTGQRARWIDVLREVTLSVPETKEVFLTQVGFREGNEPLKIRGRAVDAEAVNRFVEALIRSSLFRRVERRTLQQHRDRKDRHRWDFDLNIYLFAPEEEVSR